MTEPIFFPRIVAPTIGDVLALTGAMTDDAVDRAIVIEQGWGDGRRLIFLLVFCSEYR